MSEYGERVCWAISSWLNYRLRRLQSVVAFRSMAASRYATGSVSSNEFRFGTFQSDAYRLSR